MRKFILIILVLILALIAVAIFGWMNRTSIAAHYIGKELSVPAKLQSLEFDQSKTILSHLWIGNPSQSKTPTSFLAKNIEIDASFKQLRSNPLVIEDILMEDIFVGIEIYSGNDTNWAYMLHKQSKKKSSRDYIIRKLTIRNLTVRLTKADGSVKTYPTIPEMEFTNITSETGFPVDEIEKAIFDLVMKEIFRKFGLEQLNKALDAIVPGGSPLKRLPIFN